VGRFAGYGFPWGTLVVNVLGCLAVGALGALFAPSNPLNLRHDLRMLTIVGVLGGFTTFSSFGLDTLTLAQRVPRTLAMWNVAGQVAAGLAAVALGYAAAARL
jgi:CrcB protein